MNVSEIMFEELCGSVGIDCRRIAAADTRTPDFEVEMTGHRVVVEIKQFDPNEEEAESIRRIEAGGIGGTTATPGDRIRKAIRSAAPQLKALSNGACPALLVIYNNNRAPQHTDPYSVATAMDGLDVVPVLVPRDPSISPKLLDTRSGPGKKMTPTAHTTISAIGVLGKSVDDGRTHLRIYHNRHTRNPIDPEWLRHPLIHHFRRPLDATSSLENWEKV